MTRIDLRAALDMLPRHKRARGRKKGDWCVTGPIVITNAQVTPLAVDKAISKIIKRYDCAGLVPIVKRVDVTGTNVWVIHRTLKASTLMWLYRHLRTYEKLPFSKLPIYVLYKGRIIIWNGTHRMTLGRLMQKPVRARVIDLDDFLRREKKDPASVSGIKRVIIVKPRKKVKHGKAKH
jgi:hypothetical protein